MTLYNITLISNNKKSLNKFFYLFIDNIKLTNFRIINKIIKKNLKKKRVTILKSPHVNKKAQEQFELNYFKYQFNIYLPKDFKLVLLLKSIQKKLLTDIKKKIKIVTSPSIITRKNKKICDPANFNSKNYFILNYNSINLKKNNTTNNSLDQYINIFDIYGENF